MEKTLNSRCTLRKRARFLLRSRNWPPREITFGGGRRHGRTEDLDRFDPLLPAPVLWNKGKGEIAGAYRMGEVPKILARLGPKGFTPSRCSGSRGFFRAPRTCAGVGAVFHPAGVSACLCPLLLLWKAIGGFVAKHPEYSRLIGAVSVSNQYSPASRELIARYFEKQNAKEFRGAVRARRPLRGNLVQKWETGGNLLGSARYGRPLGADLDPEPDGKGIPILVRQYVRLGGKLLTFSVGSQFGNTWMAL